MAGKVSNPRDLVLLLLADLLFVERRLAGEVLPAQIRGVRDGALRAALEEHHEETKVHVTRLETAFRRLDAAPSANLSRAFEGAVAQHDELAGSIVDAGLADLFHANAALHVEHYEIAGYRTLLRVAPTGVAEPLEDTLRDEEQAAKTLEKALERLARAR
jgi:ferritin-like metal-binding protein YciE